jgi:hypothetical protein
VTRQALAIAVIFTPFVLGFELLALHHGYWSFPGEYVAEVAVLGQRFPLEELVFFVVLSAPAVVALYAVYKNWKGLPVSAE